MCGQVSSGQGSSQTENTSCFHGAASYNRVEPAKPRLSARARRFVRGILPVDMNFCNQCGAGKGIALVAKVNRCDYATAAKWVDEYLGN